MARTRHFQQRMSQRGISLEMVELVRRFGEPDQDKIVLGRKSLRELIAAMQRLERTAKEAMDKGGCVVVEDGDSLITTYRLDSYDRRKSRSPKRRQI
ncbi:DUF4258 domain-containing protein [Bradyrhizobium arachidis]|uniref:DUF4258 domain-containing protein n=1 Tax=Bradyrhizobium arachidis TaxID=858423 RepID=A0AAE7NND6_9BRAD|nr:DUF4258 domain-containing protein [Bradyrhizobium arachidis]QOZ66558.1 DUF4258 domain-containing protein [Bradyrhizobium arachidis]SFV19637.1 protein of unknown function [Bradyrhizobium arachidis]